MTQAIELNPAFVVCRKLIFNMPVNSGEIGAVISTLNQMTAVTESHFNADKAQLTIIYDASRLQLDDVLDLATTHNLSLKQCLSQKLRVSYGRFVDQNIRDNASHKPHCCNKPPRI